MQNEGRMNEEWWRMMISSCLRVLLSDEWTNEQTDICDCRVAFVTENCWYHCHLYPNCWKFLTNFTVVAEVFSEILHISRISMAYQGIFSKHTIKRLISIQSGLLSSRILKATFQWMTLSKCHDPTPWKWKSFLARLIFKAKLKTCSKPWPHMYQYKSYYWIEYAVSMQCEWPHKSEWPITAMVFVISKLLAWTSGPLGLVDILKSGWEWSHMRDFI